MSRDESSIAFTCGKVVPARRVSLSVEASHPGQLSPRDKLKYHVNGSVVLGNMPRRFLPRDNSLSRDNMLSRVHVNRVLALLIMTGREASETYAKLKLKISKRTLRKGINECLISPVIKLIQRGSNNSLQCLQ